MPFLTDYLDYASANEAPTMFHVWGGYMCLSAVVSRRCWFVMDDGFLYPHLYILYVGKAGNGKGEAMRKVKRVISELADIPFSGNVETPEGFIRYICGNPAAKPDPIQSPVRSIMKGPTGQLTEVTPMTIFATEFVNFIAQNPEGWINLLNDIWDADFVYHYRTKGQGEDLVLGPSINLLGALTTDVAANLQKQRIIGTGLGRRTIFQYGERQWDNPHPRREFTSARLAARESCVCQLREIQKLSGLMQNTPEADEWWDEWYCTNLSETPLKPLSVQSWYASKSDIMIKLAMLTALSEKTMSISVLHYEIVSQYLTLLEEDLPKIFGGVGRNELADVAIEILDFIERQRDPIAKATLKVVFFSQCKPPNEFDDCITFLVSTGKIVEAVIELGGGTMGSVVGPAARMREWLVDHVGRVLPNVGAGFVLPKAVHAEVGPSPSPQPPPTGSLTMELPTSAQLLDETEAGQVPKPNPPQEG